MKYVLVTGGVISGVGKGVISSSVGAILKACGFTVTSIKIDPYINIDAGTFSPYEHGEVFVLDDGGEVDLDLGNYERFLDIDLHRDNNITTGKIYQTVIEKERRGDYLGKTVQVVPHITNAIQEWIENVALQPVDKSGKTPDVCVIELGGVVGDIEGMPYVEAMRQFQFRVGLDNMCCCHVSLIPQTSGGELKSKPTQMSVRELRGFGLTPDLILARCKVDIDEGLKQKISMFCHVGPNQVISVPDVSSVYRVPRLLYKQGLVKYIIDKLKLSVPAINPKSFLYHWKQLADRHDQPFEEVCIAIVGKYTKLEDAYMSVIKALKHSAIACKRKLVIKWVEAENLEETVRDINPVVYHEAWQSLCRCNGILVPGGFGSRGSEGKIQAARWARKNNRPYLGICLGLQIAVIEFARDVLGWDDANSTEINPDTPHPVVIEMPEHNPGQLGGTMRLGKRKTIFKKKSRLAGVLYDNADYIEERHRHRYEEKHEVRLKQDIKNSDILASKHASISILASLASRMFTQIVRLPHKCLLVNPTLVPHFEEKGMQFVGQDIDGERMEIMELDGHPFYLAVQFHPEFLSRPLKPSPPYLGFILASSDQLERYLQRGGRLSPRLSYINFVSTEERFNTLDLLPDDVSTSSPRDETLSSSLSTA